MSKRIDAAWRAFAEQVVPADAPDVQHQECRRAFYAGAQAFYGTLMQALEPGQEPTDADLTMMAELHDELQLFRADVLAGRA